jgi:cyclopropane fatty-acyl-phospholipid synthase-like methyltransferase
MNVVVLVRAKLDVLSGVEILDIGCIGGPLTGFLVSQKRRATLSISLAVSVRDQRLCSPISSRVLFLVSGNSK